MTVFRSLPSGAALRALAAFAETGSVVRAAAALNVSHPAISQQLKALEAHLGLALFDRSGQGLELTAEGRRLAEAAVAGFAGIARAVAELTGADEGRPLMLSTTAAFAGGWLMPRLPDFSRRNPGIDLMIDASPELRRLEPGGFDLAIRYGDGDWPGVESQPLLETPIVAVAAPALLGGIGEDDLAALAGLPWLQEHGTNEATGVLARHGLRRAAGLTALPGNFLLDAARNGQGIAMIPRAFVEADLAAGRLRIVHSDREREGYHLVSRLGVQRPAARAFARWAMRQAAMAPTPERDLPSDDAF
jgi:LysR family transcriptional regulator, glycine cleavage system transcriptional activator